MKNKKSYSIDELLNIMDELREKCPWDKEQTMDSLKILTIEESYELQAPLHCQGREPSLS
jgi:XTP/dITP diphosphohydrolase